MAITIDWTVEIGDPVTPTDFTSRVSGLQLKQKCDVSKKIAHTAVITLNNFDGALTPNAGGTYSSFDWFAQAVFVKASVNGGTEFNVYQGLLTDFELIDNGTASYVTLQAVDWLSIVGRFRKTLAGGLPDEQQEGVFEVLRDVVEASGVGVVPEPLPLLNGTNSTVAISYLSTPHENDDVALPSTVGYVSDVIYNRMLQSDLIVILPTEITQAASLNTYKFATLSNVLTRTVDYHEFVFAEDATGANEIPFTNLRTGFANDRLINNATFQRSGSTEQIATDQTSQREYGNRSIAYTAVLNTTDAGALAAAELTVERFKNTRFTARQLQVSNTTIAESPSGLASEIELLLDIQTGFWQTAAIEYTPTGAGSQLTDNCVISGRTIQAVPGRTTITLDLLPAQDYQSFVLNSSTLGVLDTNRLG